MSRGFALWILSKFAMLFFIFALAAIMLGLANSQQSSSCSTQAQNTADLISSKVSQVVDSPSEDEKQLFALQPIIPLGSGGERYTMNLTLRHRTSGSSFLSFDLQPLSQLSCIGANSVSLGKTGAYHVVYYDGSPKTATDFSSLFFTPSESKDLSLRSRYLIILKCNVKTPNGQKYLFIENCRESDSGRCALALDAPFIDSCCGWQAGGACNFGGAP